MTPTSQVRSLLPQPQLTENVRIKIGGIFISNATAIALQKIQHELKVSKTRDNKFGGYKFRSCEDIMEAVKPLLASYNSILIVNDRVELIGDHFYVVATATICSTEDDAKSISTTAFAREAEEQKGMQPPQCTGSSSSYARKYALSGLFCLDDTKDPDAGTGRTRKSSNTATKTVSVDSELKAARQAVTKLSKDLIDKGITRDKITSTIADNNGGKQNPNSIPSVEACNKIIKILEGLK